MRVHYLRLALLVALYTTHSAAVSLGQDEPTEHRLLRVEAPGAADADNNGNQEGIEGDTSEERGGGPFEGFSMSAIFRKILNRFKSIKQSMLEKAAAKQERLQREKVMEGVSHFRNRIETFLVSFTKHEDVLSIVMAWEKTASLEILSNERMYRKEVVEIAKRLKAAAAVRAAKYAAAARAATEAAARVATEAAARAATEAAVRAATEAAARAATEAAARAATEAAARVATEAAVAWGRMNPLNIAFYVWKHLVLPTRTTTEIKRG